MGRVVVAGSINMDIVVSASRHPHIGETVPGHAVNYFPGGKGANLAVAAAKLGAPTTLIARYGDDAFGDRLVGFLRTAGVDISQVRQCAGIPSGTALITLANADNTIIAVPGANAHLTASDIDAIDFSAADVAVSQFEIPLPVVDALYRRASSAGATTILNPAPALAEGRDLFSLADVLVLNETELGFFAGGRTAEGSDSSVLIDAARSLQNNPSRIICVTRGRQGVLALVQGEVIEIPALAVNAVDTTGAGDCFAGALAAQLAAQQPFRDALVFANRAASVCVQRAGAAPSMPSAAEIAAIR